MHRRGAQALGWLGALLLGCAACGAERVEATRLGVEASECGALARNALLKASYLHARAAGAAWIVATARPPLDRLYESLLFRDVLEGGAAVPMRHVGNLPHRVMALLVDEARALFSARRHPLAAYFLDTEHSDLVIDAIDNVRAKVAIALTCTQRRIPLVMAGGAGGKTDPGRLVVDDLARTVQDPLLSKVRARLRKEHGFSRDPRRKFGIDAVFSTEPVRYPEARACLGTGAAAALAPQGLACAGYGSSMAVTASAGLFCAARALDHLLQVRVACATLGPADPDNPESCS